MCAWLQGVHVLREAGTVHSSQPSDADNLTLEQIKHQTGDYLDVAVIMSRR